MGAMACTRLTKICQTVRGATHWADSRCQLGKWQRFRVCFGAAYVPSQACLLGRLRTERRKADRCLRPRKNCKLSPHGLQRGLASSLLTLQLQGFKCCKSDRQKRYAKVSYGSLSLFDLDKRPSVKVCLQDCYHWTNGRHRLHQLRKVIR